jgi:hypothetical protein
MGVDPGKVEYLKLASRSLDASLPKLGNAEDIEVAGAAVASVRQDFKLLDEFRRLRL